MAAMMRICCSLERIWSLDLCRPIIHVCITFKDFYVNYDINNIVVYLEEPSSFTVCPPSALLYVTPSAPETIEEGFLGLRTCLVRTLDRQM